MVQKLTFVHKNRNAKSNKLFGEVGCRQRAEQRSAKGNVNLAAPCPGFPFTLSYLEAVSKYHSWLLQQTQNLVWKSALRGVLGGAHNWQSKKSIALPKTALLQQ